MTRAAHGRRIGHLPCGAGAKLDVYCVGITGTALRTVELNERQTEVWQQSVGYIVQREVVVVGEEAQAPVQWNSVKMARPELRRSDIAAWPRAL